MAQAPLQPNFIQFPGNVIAEPPCRMLNANQYGFFVKGCSEKIQTYIDTTLNAVKSDEFRFKALSAYTLLTFTDIENIASKVPPFSEQGWMQETDIIFWLPVAKMVNKRGKEKVDHIYWYPAFITVNNIYALINGRETWGYNKYLCDYKMPNIGELPQFFELSLDAFQPFSPNTKMAKHKLLEVNLVEQGGEHPVSDFVELVKEAFEILKSDTDFFDLDLNAIKQLLDGFVNPQMDQILFKQLPNGDGSKAVYQGVVHSPSIIKKVHSAKIYKHEFDVTVYQLDTFPLGEMFGIYPGTHRALLPFNVVMDFDQEKACEIIATKGL
ncbi:hypothetical protein AN214_02212 [Pseudoalteromonas sp. P1-9]|uniref:hypothetical protein n=1 Tax=Pseudoalteromonas sp. P1-9 TaxID=1710354 RepID=UPI0006D6501A|nr:hypothetical protein [Pseudoalteromonas sp. P1-9]KPV95644.1 hypothetical protein AN214_02212 [Pseudoalteromonas sp. P1-9]